MKRLFCTMLTIVMVVFSILSSTAAFAEDPSPTDTQTNTKLAILFEGKQYVELSVDSSAYEEYFKETTIPNWEHTLHLEEGIELRTSETGTFSVTDEGRISFVSLTGTKTSKFFTTAGATIDATILLPQGEILLPGEDNTSVCSTEINHKEFVILMTTQNGDYFVRFVKEEEANTATTDVEELLTAAGLETSYVTLENAESESIATDVSSEVIFDGITYTELKVDLDYYQTYSEDAITEFELYLENGIIIGNYPPHNSGFLMSNKNDNSIGYMFFDGYPTSVGFTVMHAKLTALLPDGEVIKGDSEVVIPDFPNYETITLLFTTSKGENYFVRFVETVIV